METIQMIKRVSRVEETEGGEQVVVNKGVIRRVFDFTIEKKAPLAIIAIVALIGYGVYAKYFDLTDAERAQKELAAAVAAVSELMIVPEGDEPVLATVTDAETLTKQQAFFTGAVDGDQLLLFPKNMKAVIYSPSRNKIINAGPIEQQGQAQKNTETKSSAASAATESAKLSVEVRNGTAKIGYASTVAMQIGESAGYSIVKVSDAVKKNYTKTIVVDRAAESGKKLLASSLAVKLGGELVADLPNGEKGTNADALVILGE